MLQCPCLVILKTLFEVQSLSLSYIWLFIYYSVLLLVILKMKLQFWILIFVFFFGHYTYKLNCILLLPMNSLCVVYISLLFTFLFYHVRCSSFHLLLWKPRYSRAISLNSSGFQTVNGGQQREQHMASTEAYLKVPTLYSNFLFSGAALKFAVSFLHR